MVGFSSLWGGGASAQAPVSMEDQNTDLLNALCGVGRCMNDEVEDGQQGLLAGESNYHQLGLGTVLFLKAALGLERDIMQDASQKLGVCETGALDALSQIQKGKAQSLSKLFPPGTEYRLVHAEAQALSSLLGILTESVPEAIKGVWKLRRAIKTLQEIEKMEKKAIDGGQQQNLDSRTSITGSATSRTTAQQTPNGRDSDDDNDGDGDDGAFEDAEEHSGTGKEQLGPTTQAMKDMSVTASDTTGSSTAPNGKGIGHSTASLDPAMWTEPTDKYISSGYRVQFGIMLTVLSLIPQGFAPVLSMIGFAGDRDRGLTLLWECVNMHLSEPDSGPEDASSGSKINSAVAGLFLTSFYSNLVAILDVIPKGSIPKQRLEAFLHKMLVEFPNGRLWMLEDSRMAAANRDLRKAVRILEEAGPPSEGLKQVEALRWFEHGLDSAYMHEYEKCSTSFIKILDLNSWSPAMYYYVAGCAQVELYRNATYSIASPDAAAAKGYAAKAEEYFQQVAKLSGKKKLLARPLPFDAFVGRKVSKFTKRAETFGVPLVEAIGVSPLEEINFFWGGHSRMDQVMLQESLARLWWSDGGENDIVSATLPPRAAQTLRPSPYADRESTDERAILALLRGAVHRSLADYETARALLTDQIVDSLGSEDFKGPLKDNWPPPVARYELAVLAWIESGESEVSGGAAVDAATRDSKLKECSRWMEEVSRWGEFDLDARVGMKVRTGRETLKKMGY